MNKKNPLSGKLGIKLPTLLLMSLAITTGCAAPANNGVISVLDAWARPAANGNNSAIYFVLDNPFAENEKLLSANSELASATEIHMTMIIEPESSGSENQEMMPGMEDGVMRMMPQENVPIPANTAVAFEPGGLHLMLIGVQQDLNNGDTISLTLEFEQAGTIVIEVPVETREIN